MSFTFSLPFVNNKKEVGNVNKKPYYWVMSKLLICTLNTTKKIKTRDTIEQQYGKRSQSSYLIRKLKLNKSTYPYVRR